METIRDNIKKLIKKYEKDVLSTPGDREILLNGVAQKIITLIKKEKFYAISTRLDGKMGDGRD